MICTVTFNPSLDYIVDVEDFKLGLTNRTSSELILPGGKGINVSIVLRNLGICNRALGFTAGFTGDEIIRRLQEMGVESDFIRIERGISRINLKLKSDEESEINGMGPDITGTNVELLFEQLNELKAGDILVLSGSIPSSIRSSIYKEIMERLQGRGIQIVVDAEKALLMEVLPLHPFLIKPNNHELEAMLGRTLSTKEEVLEGAKELQALGARNVLVSMAGDGAVLLTEDGAVYREGVCRGTVVNSVGAGDSMVAGFLAGYLKTGDYGYALKLGTASGGATAFSHGIGSREKIMELFTQLNKK